MGSDEVAFHLGRPFSALEQNVKIVADCPEMEYKWQIGETFEKILKCLLNLYAFYHTVLSIFVSLFDPFYIGVIL